MTTLALHDTEVFARARPLGGSGSGLRTLPVKVIEEPCSSIEEW
ncbi:hypothetical protein [Streptomyces tendae]